MKNQLLSYHPTIDHSNAPLFVLILPLFLLFDPPSPFPLLYFSFDFTLVGEYTGEFMHGHKLYTYLSVAVTEIYHVYQCGGIYSMQQSVSGRCD